MQRWHQRWFVLRRLRGAFILEYYKDRNSVTPKGTIDLQYCEQVDQGLTFETKKFDHNNAYIFDIVTPKRKYFLVSRSEEDMIRWVRSICEVCGFHLEGDEPNEGIKSWVENNRVIVYVMQSGKPATCCTGQFCRNKIILKLLCCSLFFINCDNM